MMSIKCSYLKKLLVENLKSFSVAELHVEIVQCVGRSSGEFQEVFSEPN